MNRLRGASNTGALSFRATLLSSAVLLGAALGGAGCVSKTVYLQKVDEAIRFRQLHETCSAELDKAFAARRILEKDLKDEQRVRAICEFDRKNVTTQKGESESALREQLADVSKKYKTIADDMNELRAKNASCAENTRALEKRLGDMRAEQKREPDLSDVSALLKTEVDASDGALTLLRPKGAVVLRIAHRVLFKKRNAMMSADGKALIARLADAMKRMKDRLFLVQGHEDSAPVLRKLGSPLELSHFQAVVVARELARGGLDPQRITTAGHGALKPLAAEGAENAADQNRRVEIVITPAPATERLEVITPDGN